MGTVTIGGAALNQTPLDWENNLRNIISAIEEARKKNIDILCTPELCLTGYGCEDLFMSKWLPEKALIELMKLQEHCKDITAVIGVPVRYENKVYNSACIINDQNILGFYLKQNLAKTEVYYEPRWFTPWPAHKSGELIYEDQKFPVGDLTFKVKNIRIGFEICEDAWVDTRPAENLKEKKVDLIINPSASHFELLKTIDRHKLIIDSSADYNCTYLYTNVLGNEAGQLIFDGEVIIASHGKLLKKSETLVFKDFNITSTSIDFNSKPAKSILLPEYDKNAEFAQAVSLGLYDYLRKSKSKGFVISLSGGADSSTCAVLVAEMIRRGIKELGLKTFLEKAGLKDLENIIKLESNNQSIIKKVAKHLLTCAYQATENSSPETLEAAKKLAENIGAEFHHWSVDEEIRSYIGKIEENIGRKLSWEKDDLTLQNIQARSRSPIIWMLANVKKALLLVTSNRSEAITGYATMDGDTSGSLAPLAGIDKDFIRSWLKWAEKELDYPALSYVNKLTPTAELRPLEKDQADESDLMPYKILVKIEKEVVLNSSSPIQAFNVLKKQNLEKETLLIDHIIKFFNLMAKSQWKRERTAPSFSLDIFNISPRSWYRFPVLSAGFKSEIEELKKIKTLKQG